MSRSSRQPVDRENGLRPRVGDSRVIMRAVTFVERAFSRAVGVPLFTLLLLTGCQGDGGRDTADGRERVDLADQVSIEYDRVGGAGYIDQALTVRNSSDVPLTIEADIESLDSSGAVLPKVAAHGVYGATQGRQVLVPGENVDFLVFTGRGASDVRDVQLADVRVEASDFPLASEVVEAVPLDTAGNELDYPTGFSSVELRNPNPVAVPVRVVSIVWNQPAEGQPQQALEVVPLSRVTMVPAEGETVLEVSPRNRRAISRYADSNALSLKAYFSNKG